VVQTALLYTTSSGERRINVHTMCKPVTTVVTDLFRNVDVDAVSNLIAKVALDHALRSGFTAARTYLQRSVVDIIRAYRTATSGSFSGGGMMPGGRGPVPPSISGPSGGSELANILPENLMLLPLYTLAMQKCTLYRGGDIIRSDERSALVYRMLTMPVVETKHYIYPRLFSLHDMEDAAGRPDPENPALIKLPAVVNLTAARLVPDGIFLMDNGVELYLWFGRATNPALLNALLNASSIEGVDMNTVQLMELPNDYSARINSIVQFLQQAQPQAQRIRFVREGANDMNEHRFSWHLVEDRQNFRGGGVTYAEYLPVIQKESQLAQLGGSDPIPS
jgi:protein transport protein SEC24